MKRRKSRKFRPGDIVAFEFRGGIVHGVVERFKTKHWSVVPFDARHPQNGRPWSVPEMYMRRVSPSKVPNEIWAAFMKWQHGVKP